MHAYKLKAYIMQQPPMAKCHSFTLIRGLSTFPLKIQENSCIDPDIRYLPLSVFMQSGNAQEKNQHFICAAFMTESTYFVVLIWFS